MPQWIGLFTSAAFSPILDYPFRKKGSTNEKETPGGNAAFRPPPLTRPGFGPASLRLFTLFFCPKILCSNNREKENERNKECVQTVRDKQTDKLKGLEKCYNNTESFKVLLKRERDKKTKR